MFSFMLVGMSYVEVFLFSYIFIYVCENHAHTCVFAHMCIYMCVQFSSLQTPSDFVVNTL